MNYERFLISYSIHRCNVGLGYVLAIQSFLMGLDTVGDIFRGKLGSNFGIHLFSLYQVLELNFNTLGTRLFWHQF